MDETVPLRPAWVEVNTSAIEQNTHRLVQIIGSSTELMAMVKANAYGHGAVAVSRAALRGGAKWLGVNSVGEGIELRDAGIIAPTLVAGPTPMQWARAGVSHDLSLSVFSLDVARAISVAARELKMVARTHVKIDTGMTRLGVNPSEAADFALALSKLENVQVEGVFTHLARSDESNDEGREYTRQQLERFRRVCDALDRAKLLVPYRHAANSPASLHLPDARFNLARSGILIYGLDPSPEIPRPDGFIPALAFKTAIASIRSVPAGTPISYGGQYRTKRPSRIAVLMVGYADGFRKLPHTYGEVLVRGKRATIAGSICMDQTMIDITAIAEAQVGDEVVLIGKQGADEIRAEEVAQNLGTNNYEVISTISARLERRYLS
jgi:Alr-MurF fusion protein